MGRSGGSDAPATGYDKASLAEDIHRLLLALGHADEVSLVGHDIGGTVSYAYAAAHPDSIRRLTVIEAPQIDESLYQFPSVTPAGPGFWNFGFCYPYVGCCGQPGGESSQSSWRPYGVRSRMLLANRSRSTPRAVVE
jgi:pimeloyl-ACP methyl ester carboxylesterase